jgi:hypothetical protein
MNGAERPACTSPPSKFASVETFSDSKVRISSVGKVADAVRCLFSFAHSNEIIRHYIAMDSEALQGIDRQPARKRHVRRAELSETMTLQLSTFVAAAIRAVVRAGEVSSAGAFIEEAVRQRLRECRRERVYAAYAEASRDQSSLPR